MTKLKLIGTRTSHFARKVRILLHEIGVEFDFALVSDLLQTDATAYGNNPLMQVPVLLDGDEWIIESDCIARYLVETRAPQDPLGVLTLDTVERRWLAVLNGIMAQEAQIVMSALCAPDTMPRAYSRKLSAAVTFAISWIDSVTDLHRENFTYIDLAMICMWEHHLHFDIAPAADRFPRIAERVARFAARPSVATTSPYLAAGAGECVWRPGSSR